MVGWLKAVVASAACLGFQTVFAQADALQVRSWAAACANCHGTQGLAQPGMVALAGVSQVALRSALREFKAGTRPATIMQQLAKGYTDEQLDQLAAYFAAQKK